MCPIASDLADGDSLPGGDEVARYCPPGKYDQESDVPAVGAFIQDPDGKGLSVNRLQYYQDENRTGAVDRIRAEVRGYYCVRERGRFVVFNVARAKDAAREKGSDINIIYDPELPKKSSHSLVVDLTPDGKDEYRVATALVRLITKADTYPGII